MNDSNFYLLSIKVKYFLYHRFNVDAISLSEAKLKAKYSTLYGDVSISEYNLWKDVDHGEYSDIKLMFEDANYSMLSDDKLLSERSKFVYVN